MAVGVDIADNVHVSVEEYQELMTFLVVDLVVCKVQLELEAVENLRVVVCEVQLGVSFHQVEGGVHGLVSHQTVLGKLVVLELALPVARHCFEVSNVVCSVLLDKIHYLVCELQRVLVAACAVVAGKRIDKERLAVAVREIVLYGAVVVHAPVNAAIFLVDALFGQELIRVLCHVQQRGILQLHIRVGIEPQNAGVQDNALFALLVDIKRAVHESGETAVLIIAELVPERDYVSGQFLYKFFSFHALVPLVLI